jgi:hydrogenase 3 maturation protease
MHLTTHNIPLSFLISYLEKLTREIIFIGIQPKIIDYSTSISPEILESSLKIIKILRDKKFNLIKKL